LGVGAQFWMFGKKFFSRGGTSGLAGGTLYDPFRRLEINGANGYGEINFDRHFMLALDALRV
jgi:hypothetical protein